MVVLEAPPNIKTPQLLLRAPEGADVEALFEVLGDPEAMRYTWVAADRDAVAHRLAAFGARFALDGFAPWTAVLRSNRRIVGWGGLNRDPEAPDWGPEVSYFVHPEYWGRGLATELVDASLHIAFRDLELPEVFAFTKPENRGSCRVLQKTGFEFARYVEELERDQYVLPRERWETIRQV